MTTTFYLPASGSAPLGSLAINANWERSDGLVRRPCKIAKSNTALATDTRTWLAALTQQWCWLQFQSPNLKAAYSWTAADTVSMVIGKCAETTNSGDTHLAYVVRVVSADGSVIRGVIGLLHETSTEYPLVASAATRIHSARTNGATVFSSEIGDRIIIEIGLHGVTPALEAIQMRFGDPTATADFALTAGLTTDLDPWVRLSRTVEFGQVIAVGQASEIDSVNSILWRPKNRFANENTEIETSQIIGKIKNRSVVYSVETDSVFSMVVSKPKNIAVNQSSETESTISFSKQKIRSVGQSSEVEFSQNITKVKNRALIQTNEVDVSQSIQEVKKVTLNQSSEIDSSQIILWSPKNRLILRSNEIDSSQILSKSKIRSIVQSNEVDSSQSVQEVKIRTIFQIGEVDSSLHATASEPEPVNRVSEIDSVTVITHRKVVLINQASEIDSVKGITRGSFFGQTFEIDSSLQIAKIKQKYITQVNEVEFSQNIHSKKIVILNQSNEIDSLQHITASEPKPVNRVSEIDSAKAITYRKVAHINQISEIDLAQIFIIIGGTIPVPPTPHNIGVGGGGLTQAERKKKILDDDEEVLEIMSHFL